MTTNNARELDARVAEALGWRRDERYDGWWIPPGEKQLRDGAVYTAKPGCYSIDPAAAAEVIEAMAQRGWFVEITLRPAPYNDVEVVLCRGFRNRLPVKPEHYANAPTLPLAICRAALAVMEGE